MYEHRVFNCAPETMLHELAHAYHNIELGLDHPGIRDGYEHTKGAGLYQRVPDRGRATRWSRRMPRPTGKNLRGTDRSVLRNSD